MGKISNNKEKLQINNYILLLSVLRQQQQQQQQQQVYFKLNIAYKACARNQRRLFEAGTREKRKLYKYICMLNEQSSKQSSLSLSNIATILSKNQTLITSEFFLSIIVKAKQKSIEKIINNNMITFFSTNENQFE